MEEIFSFQTTVLKFGSLLGGWKLDKKCYGSWTKNAKVQKSICKIMLTLVVVGHKNTGTWVLIPL